MRILIAVLVTILIVSVVRFLKKKKSPTVIEDIPSDLMISKGELAEVCPEHTDVIFQMEMLPAETFREEASLVEITDSKVLAQIDNLIPGLAQAGNAANNAVQAAAANG